MFQNWSANVKVVSETPVAEAHTRTHTRTVDEEALLVRRRVLRVEVVDLLGHPHLLHASRQRAFALRPA